MKRLNGLRLASNPHPRASTLRLAAGTFAAFGCLALLTRLDARQVLEALRSANGAYVAAAVALNLAYLLLRGFRSWLLIRSAGRSDLLEATRISSVGVLMSSTYPGLGEASRLMLLRRRSLSIGSAAAVVFEERLVDAAALGLALMIGVTALSTSGLGHFSDWPGPFLAGMGAALLLAVFGATLSRRRQREGGVNVRLNSAATVLARGVAFLNDMRTSAEGLLRDRNLCFGVLGLTAAIHFVSAAAAWTTFRSLALDAPFATALLTVALVNLGLVLLPSPLGLGLYQATGLAVLGGLAATPEQAITAATILQAVNYGCAALAGVPAMAFELWTPKRPATLVQPSSSH